MKFTVSEISRKRRVLSLMAVGVACWPLLSWAAAEALIERHHLDGAGALVVLSGSAGYKERTHWAAKLFHEGRAPRIILTSDVHPGGWSQERQRTMLFYERAVEDLQRAGVPLERIDVLPQPVESTYEEAMLLRHYATQRGLRSVLVVTSPYHSRRANWTLSRVFRNTEIAIGVDAPPPGEQSPSSLTWWLRRRGWSLVALEYPKLIYYCTTYR